MENQDKSNGVLAVGESSLGSRGQNPVISLRNVSLKFTIHFHKQRVTLRESFSKLLGHEKHGDSSKRIFWVYKDLSLDIHRGEIVGVIGRNGAGKTTLLRTMAGIYSPNTGTVKTQGRISCMLNLGAGFNFLLSGRENIYLNGMLLGFSTSQVDDMVDDIIEFSGLADFIDAPLKTYSTGMRSRLGFSIAINVEPEIMLLDEILATGDAEFKKKSGNIIERFHDQDKTVVYVSHSMAKVRKICTRVVWLDKGEIVMNGDPDEVVSAYVEATAGNS
ncbi:ABC transporter ATP-binding protein [Candidatus Hydrogenedentota bacterium]